MKQAPAHRRVFLGYRSTDRVVVGEFAARLRRDGVDAWYDHWEIVPGDDIVAKMDQGIDSCTAGLVFISHAWLEGSWVHKRVDLAGVAQGGGWHPARSVRLRKLACRSGADYEAIRDTMLGIDRRPGITTALQAHTRSVTVRLEDAGTGRATVSTARRSPRSTRRGAHQPHEWSRLAMVPPGCGYVASNFSVG